MRRGCVPEHPVSKADLAGASPPHFYVASSRVCPRSSQGQIRPAINKIARRYRGTRGGRLPDVRVVYRPAVYV